MESFDVHLLAEMMERQQRDAERIVMLCNALSKVTAELEALKAKADAPAAGPAGKAP